MKLANIVSAVSVILLGSLAVGCKANVDDDKNADTADLGTSESQLVEDDSEATETDDDIEAGIDDPLSGATAEDPGTPAEGSTDDEVLENAQDAGGRSGAHGARG